MMMTAHRGTMTMIVRRRPGLAMVTAIRITITPGRQVRASRPRRLTGTTISSSRRHKVGNCLRQPGLPNKIGVMRWPIIMLLLCLPWWADAATFKIDNHTFTVADGFVVERVAGPPLVDRPIVAD